MEKINQRKTIIILIAVLLAVVVVSVALVVLLPGNEEPGSPTTQTPAPQSAAGSGEFNLRVLDRSTYKNLNSGLLQNGLLPVKPPANTGKANPFL